MRIRVCQCVQCTVQIYALNTFTTIRHSAGYGARVPCLQFLYSHITDGKIALKSSLLKIPSTTDLA